MAEPPRSSLAPEAGLRSRRGAVAAAGWWTAVRLAIAALVTVAVLGELLALLVYAAGSGERPSIVSFLRLGALLVYGFHHVGVEVDGSGAAPSGQAFGEGSDVLVVLAPMAGTVLALWLLAVGGRAVAGETGGSAVVRAIQGAKVAVPYAAVLGALSWAVTIPAGDLAAGSPSIHAAHVGAFLWPLALGVVAGSAGGLRAAPRPSRFRLAAGAVSGASWMLGVGLVLAFAGLVMLAPINPDATRAYFGPFDEGAVEGVALIAFTLLVVPNMAMLALVPAMGACLTAAGAVGDASFSVCLLSYSNFPSPEAFQALLAGGQPADPLRLELPAPSLPYFLFVAAPLIAVLVGGVVAAKRGEAFTVREGLLAGGLAGVAFGLFALLAMVLTTAGLEVGPSLGSPQLTVRAGPDLLQGPLLALAWGVVGGAVGGAFGARLRRSREGGDRPVEPSARPMA